MLFERTVTKIFGKPKTPIYFAGYYDSNNENVIKSMLLTMCIYEINYNPDSYDENSKEILNDYESKASNFENTKEDDFKFLTFLFNYEKN